MRSTLSDRPGSILTGPEALHRSILLPALLATMLLAACDGSDNSRNLIAQSFEQARSATQAVNQYYAQNHQLPSRLTDAGFNGSPPRGVDTFQIDPQNGTIIIRFSDKALAGKSLSLTPHADGQVLNWSCTSDDLPSGLLPDGCRS